MTNGKRVSLSHSLRLSTRREKLGEIKTGSVSRNECQCAAELFARQNYCGVRPPPSKPFLPSPQLLIMTNHSENCLAQSGRVIMTWYHASKLETSGEREEGTVICQEIGVYCFRGGLFQPFFCRHSSLSPWIMSHRHFFSLIFLPGRVKHASCQFLLRWSLFSSSKVASSWSQHFLNQVPLANRDGVRVFAGLIGPFVDIRQLCNLPTAFSTEKKRAQGHDFTRRWPHVSPRTRL